MPSVTKYHAKSGVIYMSVSGTTAAVVVGGFRAYTLDGSQEKVDTTEFGAGNRTSVQGFPAYKGTLTGFWASDDTTLRQASLSADGTNLYIYPSSAAPSKYVGGPAWVDMSLSGAVDAAVGVSGAFEAKGTWANAL
jgi:hypothetical protein